MFWDSSALVPLFVDQGASQSVRKLYANDPDVAMWLLSDVEFRSAIHRLGREGAIDDRDLRSALAAFDAFQEEADVVASVEATKRHAFRLLRLHPLRAADALQLGAAMVLCDGDPSEHSLATLDTRLAKAARIEGFAILP